MKRDGGFVHIVFVIIVLIALGAVLYISLNSSEIKTYEGSNENGQAEQTPTPTPAPEKATIYRYFPDHRTLLDYDPELTPETLKGNPALRQYNVPEDWEVEGENYYFRTYGHSDYGKHSLEVYSYSGDLLASYMRDFANNKDSEDTVYKKVNGKEILLFDKRIYIKNSEESMHVVTYVENFDYEFSDNLDEMSQWELAKALINANWIE